MTLLDADIPAAMTARVRCLVDVGALVVAFAAACSTQLSAGSPVRAIVVLAAFVLVPGWSLVSLTTSGPPVAMLGLAIGLSLAIDIVGSLALVWTGLFTDAQTFTAILGAGAVALLMRDAGRQMRSARLEAPAPQATG